MQSNDDSKGGFSIGYAADWLQVPPSRPDGSESPPLDSTLKVSISDAASCHFLSNFVLVAAEGTNRGFYEFLLPLAESAPAGGAFALAFKACSMASFSYREGLDPVLEQQAATYYSNALAATGAALSRPSIAASDSVLGTVLLLALFELQSGTAEGTTGWGSHIGGSIQLINSRSWKKLNTKAGMSLFVAVRTQLVSHAGTPRALIEFVNAARQILLAMISGHSIPLSKDWWGKNTFEDKYALHCLQSTMKMTHLRDELKRIIGVQEATVEDFYQLKQLLQKCQALDEAFAQWPDNLPGYFHFKVAATVTEISTNITEADAFPGPVHVYRDPWVACVWNMMRCSRIELNNLVVRCLALIHMDSDYTMLPEYAAVVQNSSEVLADSIASMPYQLGWFKTRQHLLLGEASFACGKNDSQNGLGACVAMWPLVMIQRQDFASDAQRFWANGRLQYIASRLGLRKAAFFGKVGAYRNYATMNTLLTLLPV